MQIDTFQEMKQAKAPNPLERLIGAMQNSGVYPHPVGRIEVLETHISFVLLTGDYAYKIKKPLDLGFVDCTRLEQRRVYCQEELRLNRRLAPDLYLDVVAISGNPEHPKLNGLGPAIEYAVKMRQFPQDALLDRVLARGALKAEHVDALAKKIAAFHAAVSTAAETGVHGALKNIYSPALQNFEQIRALLHDKTEIEPLEALQAWTEREYAKRKPVFSARRASGCIRECHGDMHLGNMAMLGNDVLIFDAIDFNENLRWIDVMSEAAFLVMDLTARNRSDLASRFLNAYLEITGDYGGLDILRFYLVCRALVRAKIHRIRAHQAGLDPRERDRLLGRYHEYIRLAERFSVTRQPSLLITHGLSGSGKTTFSQDLLEATGAVRVRSDLERKRVFNLAPEAKSGSGIGAGLYSQNADDMTYARLAEIAETGMRAGYPVIVDATFLKRAQRCMCRELAKRLQAPFAILDFKADEATLRERIARREQQGPNASEADLAVLEHQLANQQPLAQEELPHVIAADDASGARLVTTQLEKMAGT